MNTRVSIIVSVYNVENQLLKRKPELQHLLPGMFRMGITM